ncbi:MAG: hypothetical protein RSD36_16260 [Terrisporobacter sp.]
MAIAVKKYDLGFTHIVQATNGTMKRLEVCSPDEMHMEDYKNKEDIFYTPNTFNSPIKREREYIWQLHRLYIDIDHKNGTYPVDQYEIAIAIQELVNENKIPEPSEYVSSGRGIHIYWDIHNCHVMLLDLWEKLEGHIYSTVKTIENNINNIKVDKLATDPTRILRLPGTINSKNNEPCYSMLKNNNVYNIFELKELYLKPKASKKRKKGNITVLPTKNLYTLNVYRTEDFKKILELRHGKVKGYRNALIMFYSYHYRLANDITVEELIKCTKEFNRIFKEPYPSRELVSVCRSVNRVVKHFQEDCNKGYKFTNKYIIELLELTEEEQRKLKTIISTDEKYRRNNERRNKTRRNDEGLTQRQKQKQEKIKVIQELKAKGYKYKEIAETLNLSVDTIKHYNRCK